MKTRLVTLNNRLLECGYEFKPVENVTKTTATFFLRNHSNSQNKKGYVKCHDFLCPKETWCFKIINKML